MEKMWAGRFEGKSSELLEVFNASIEFDKALFAEDIAGSIAHAKMLANCGIIANDECEKIVKGLNLVKTEIMDGKFEFKIKDEDIHMAVEKRLSELIGAEFGGKLHTARSRNDQVAVDFRQYVLRNFLEIGELLLDLIKVLFEIASRNVATVMPGFTHLQHAQPVSLAFHMLAYICMFKRDFERLKSSFERNNFSPLGSAALAGTPHKIDRFETARNLGFAAPMTNATDGVSDRDFALEMLFDISVIFTHTSRLCEELILWNSQEFGFIKMSDAYSTGSSIMPQKKNPDVAELIRGKTGRVHGNLIALLTTLKALPLAYNKDMQEDKEAVFDSVRTAKTSLVILAAMLKSAEFNTQNMRKACEKGHLTATDLADFLVREKQIPFRQAHFITGKCVAKAESLGIDLSQISLSDLQSVDERIDESAMKVLNLDNSKNARTSYGGTSDESVKVQLAEISAWLNSL